MYQALYRKWRPKTFSEVVGQAHITDTLQRQVAEGRTAQAYLFTGTRGTGKTTCARILAKAINCEHPVDGAPCNECAACRGIDEGTLLDVTELDAASNSGVDYVRALREEAVYTPAVLRKRVYIIDEVHMLTREAFNALLKILEEPPEHLAFILATTELHKVPATILSRCQRFSFKRITPRDIESQLLKVAEAEGIPLASDGAEILSRMAGGALRDALSLLDQCRVAEGTLDSAAVLETLGLAGSVQTLQLMRCILDRHTDDALSLFDQLYRGGKDAAAVLGELLDLARDLTMAKAAPDGAKALLSGIYDQNTLSDLAEKESLRRCLYLTATLQSCCSALADSYQPRTEAELCLLRLCDESLSDDPDSLIQRIEHLEEIIKNGSLPHGAPALHHPASAHDSPRPAPHRPESERPPLPEEPPLPEGPREENRVFDIPSEPPLPRAEKKAAAPSSAGGDSTIWGQLIDQYKGRLPVNQRVFLNMASGVLSGDRLTVYCDNDFVRTSLDLPSVVQVLREVTSGYVGHPVNVFLTADTKPKQARAPKAAPLPDRMCVV